MKPLYSFCLLVFCVLINYNTSLAQSKNNGKVSPLLQNLLSAKRADETLTVFLTAKGLAAIRNEKDIQIVSEYENTNTALVKIFPAKLLSLLDRNEIVFADVYRVPKDELTTGALDISLNKISFSHNCFTDINGDSVFVSIKEQRFDTTDIDIRGRYFETNVASDVASSHAAIMATILAGAGNSSPYAKGAAWGAYLTSSGYETLLPDADAVYRQYRLSIQNHSYGTSIENYYGADAASYDMSVWKNPTLLHVFSAGNSGSGASSAGMYQGITGWANITGSFKMAKNIITVGATDSFNVVAPLSSKGPGFDGRVKPELVAFGEDGSSGAAALVSGTAALIQQAYKKDFGHLPDAALVKAVLLNSADDIGQKHVDFVSGYGSLNAFAAVNTIKEKRFFEGSVGQSGAKSFPLTIPAGVAQLKITITWTDTAASANASKALVNDLDAELQLPSSNEVWQPWVLSSYPNKDSLLLPAVRKTDTLNNVEQITVDNPQAGDYLVVIKGSKIQTASSQRFSAAYQLDTLNQFTWTFPTATDVLTSATTNVIRWQSNINGTAALEYSTDGVQWSVIDPSVNLTKQYFKWQVPDTVATGFLRMNLPAITTVLSDNFVISPQETIKVGFNCSDSVLLYWNNFRLNQYQLYRLGEKYLQPLQTVADTFIVFQKKQHPDLFYSVAPLINGKPGLRSFTINYTTQGVGCYVKTFFALLQNQNTAFLTTELGTLYNVSEISFQKISASGAQVLKTFSNPSSLNLNFIDAQLKPGANLYRLQIKLNNGNILYSNTDVVYYLPAEPVIVYPNPGQRNEPVHIVVKDPGVYSIAVYDVNGKQLYQQTLNDILQEIPAVNLSAGLYFIKVRGDNGNSFTKKLVIY
jgi:hypothetical protein